MARYVRYFTITDNHPDNWDKIISTARANYAYYWYIFHDKDVDENGDLKKKHIHIVVYDKSPSTIKKAIEIFKGCTLPNCIEASKDRSGMALIRYLVHKDDPDKYQYDPSEVVTNRYAQFAHALEDSDLVVSIFEDYEKVRRAEISVGDFIKKYKEYISGMNFYQQLQTFKSLTTIQYKEK